jgi:DNA-binding MarR family transcriptional regulator
VTRERSTEDRRRVELRLTVAGVAIKRQRKVLEPDLVAAVLERLNPAERAQALRGLELLAEASSRMVASGDMNRILRGART